MRLRDQLKAISNLKRHKESKAHERVKDLVSVCIPNFNKKDFIKDCLDSVIFQSYPKLEIIIVDDCSTDGSRLEINSFINKINNLGIKLDRTFRIISLPVRVGTAYAQNMAYYMAKGEFIANMDSDDISHPKRIETQLKFLKEKNLDVVGSNYKTFKDKIDNIITDNADYWLKYTPEEIRESYLNEVHCTCFGSLLFKREIIEEIGGLKKSFIGTEDYFFVYECFLAGYEIGNTKEILYYYRNSETQRSHLFHKN